MKILVGCVVSLLTALAIVQTVAINTLLDERAQLVHELNYWKGTDDVRIHH